MTLFHNLALVVLILSMISIRGYVAGKIVAVGKRMKMPNHVAKALFSAKGGATDDDKLFYALGVNVARQVGDLKSLLSPEEIARVADGFKDSMLNKSGDERELLTTYGPKLNEVLGGRSSQILDNEKKKGSEFATKFLLSHPRAVKTPSGLIYNEIIAGIGKQATSTSTVVVHYHGTLPDGTVFDSSKNRGDPIKFPLGNVIKGWQEGVAMMRQGGKATLIVPSDLAYGDGGSPPVIPPGATLQFEVELIEVQ